MHACDSTAQTLHICACVACTQHVQGYMQTCSRHSFLLLPTVMATAAMLNDLLTHQTAGRGFGECFGWEGEPVKHLMIL